MGRILLCACLALGACRQAPVAADAPPVAVAAPPAPDAAPAPPDAAPPGPDLDGDGHPETIALAARTLKINGIFLEHELPFPPPYTPQVVDVDRRDKRRELLVSGCAPKGCGHHLFSFGDGRIIPSPRVPGEGDTLELPGDGTLTTIHEDCGQTITTRYHWRKGKLEPKRSKKSGKRDRSKCAG